jgi:hypothetical protein
MSEKELYQYKKHAELVEWDKNPNNIRYGAYLYDTPVHLIRYDRTSGEVSYLLNGSKLIYTCCDYELHSIDGSIESIRILLNSLPAEEESKVSE